MAVVTTSSTGRESSQSTTDLSVFLRVSSERTLVSRTITRQSPPREAIRYGRAVRTRRHRWPRTEHECDYPDRGPPVAETDSRAGLPEPPPPSSVRAAPPGHAIARVSLR